MGFRPKHGSIFFSPSRHVLIGTETLPEVLKNAINGSASPSCFDHTDLSSPYTSEYGYCNDPFCDIEEGHKHGPICHMNCSCKGIVSDGSR